MRNVTSAFNWGFVSDMEIYMLNRLTSFGCQRNLNKFFL